MIGPEHRIKGIGEVSIRVKDLDAMCSFNEDGVGLRLLRREANFVFFEIAEGYAGHSQNLALFDASERTFLESKSPSLSPDRSTLHHIALSIDPEDYEPEMKRARGDGARRSRGGPRLAARPLALLRRPVGNLLELVCYDGSVG